MSSASIEMIEKESEKKFIDYVVLDHKVEESVVDEEDFVVVDKKGESSSSASLSPNMSQEDSEKSNGKVKDLVEKLEKAFGKNMPEKRDKCVVLENIHNQENESNDFEEDVEKTVLNEPEIFEPESPAPVDYSTTTLIKRTQLKNLIFDLYDLEEVDEEGEKKRNSEKEGLKSEVLIEGFVDKLPPGRNLKNSILLTWKKRFFRLSSMGILYVYDINEKGEAKLNEPIEAFNLMGGRATFEQNRVISLDDCKGNYLVFKMSESNEENEEAKKAFQKWKEAIEAQIIDRSDALWVKPNRPIYNSFPNKKMSNKV